LIYSFWKCDKYNIIFIFNQYLLYWTRLIKPYYASLWILFNSFNKFCIKPTYSFNILYLDNSYALICIVILKLCYIWFLWTCQLPTLNLLGKKNSRNFKPVDLISLSYILTFVNIWSYLKGLLKCIYIIIELTIFINNPYKFQSRVPKWYVFYVYD
jgi:hypothetical protein